MKFLFKRSLSLVLLTMLLSALTAGAAPRNDRLDRARNYVLYYGAAGDAELEELAKYDIVVIDPQSIGGDAKKKIAQLKRKNCLVIGYLSCMEVAEWHHYKSSVPDEWLLRVNGELWKPWGNNPAADLSNPKWRKLLVNKLIKTEVINYGCDGVFMDTLADVEHPGLPEDMRKKQLDGLNLLMKELRGRYPKFIFVGNWTLKSTLPVMAKYADIICWEDFQARYFAKGSAEAGFMNKIHKDLSEWQKKYNFKVYALWAAPDESEATRQEQKRSAEKAKSFGYLFYSCTGGGDYHVNFTPLEEK